jgi:MFS transporter, AAHS family, 3-hydroxyphenylpropionic acid transporter
MDATDRSAPDLGATLGFCFLAALCEGFDVQAAGIAAAGIKIAFHPPPRELGLFFSAGNLGLLLGAIAGGAIADRMGRKPVLVVSIAAFGLFSLATSTAGNMVTLMLMRLLTGVGLGGAMPNLIALAADVSRRSSRNVAMAFTYLGMPVGGAIACLLLAFAHPEHWRWVFIAGGVAPLIIASAMALWMPGVQRAHSEPQLQSTLQGFPALLGRDRWRGTVVLWVGFVLVSLTLHLMLNWLPLLLQGRGLSSGGAALAQAGFNTGGALGALSMGALLDSRWRRAAMVGVVALLPLILAALAATAVQTATMIALALLLGGAVLAVQMILYGGAGALYPQALRGTGLGAAVGVGRAGAIAGPALAAVLLGAGSTSAAVLQHLLPIVIVCGVCALLLGWRREA